MSNGPRYAGEWHHCRVTAAIKPILVVMVYRGGERFERCLDSFTDHEYLFSRIVISVTSDPTSRDVTIAQEYQRSHPNAIIDVLCTGTELPTMQHQAFWVEHLEKLGVQPNEWIYWLAYDDQIRVTGIEALVDDSGSWPLVQGIAYFGPWAMRHEQANEVFAGPWDQPLESWTSFPLTGPTSLPVVDWIAHQLKQPTYMQMSGSLCTFESFLQVRYGHPRKHGPMRIEMAVASATCNRFVTEFTEPVSIIYGRPNSDRASYGKLARKEDHHLLLWLIRYGFAHPTLIPSMVKKALEVAVSRLGISRAHSHSLEEAWLVRNEVQP